MFTLFLHVFSCLQCSVETWEKQVISMIGKQNIEGLLGAKLISFQLFAKFVRKHSALVEEALVKRSIIVRVRNIKIS